MVKLMAEINAQVVGINVVQNYEEDGQENEE